MKRIKITVVSLLLLCFIGGCKDYLDRDIIVNLTEKDVIHSYDYARARVSAVYQVLKAGFDEVDGAMLAAASDEAEHTLETSSVHRFNTGDWDAINNPDNAWAHYYSGVRVANQFLASSDDINLDYLRLDPRPSQQETYQARLAEINRWKNEVRFLRAFFYFELVKRYGGVPIITETFGLNDSPDGLSRQSLAESIGFIVDECDAVAPNLPAVPESVNLGRATKGAALSLKSQVLLYAASDLYNTPDWAGGYAHPELIALPAADRAARWKAAADAAKAVIDLTEANYALHGDYQSLFRTFNSQEIIFARRQGATNSFERANFPVGYDLGQSGTTPSQNLVDAYEVIAEDGTAMPFDWTNPAHAANPYSNRDPRLGMSLLTNNTAFKGRPVELWAGGLDGKGRDQASRTGYYLLKYVDPNINLLTGTTSVHTWIFIRLAGIYLNYAEALNEYDPGHPDIKAYIDRVRQRNGVGMPPLPIGLSQAEMRDRIRRERQVELAFEGHRFWDVRRWMIAPATLGEPLKGVDIVRTGETFTYTPATVENRVFHPKMHFYPIPQQELLKVDGLVQNPLW
ncbi:RagB/SusD family nutrient uptake outer membrane protein [Parapedobacter sp. GCM10030251]|uniref:RagB/SusD family nutrient uptake outer membrane protein n=1 Tax=Parapedobacter sp. GCM10030251 TaxID=3273419 RepID=UPI003607902C